ncbi:MAG: PQQ-binding-like beta-propeller repeat protein [Planctomycetota bacterium]
MGRLVCFAVLMVMFRVSVSAAEPSGLLAGPDWPRFLGERFDGIVDVSDSPITSFATLAWSDQPTLNWSLELGDGYGLGVVKNGHYFHFDAIAGRQRLRKVDVQTGRQIWSAAQVVDYRDMYGYETGPRCTPTIDGDQIFTLGVDGQLTARSTDDGSELWTIDTTAEFGVIKNFFGVGSSPLVIDDMVLVMVGGSPAEDQSVAPGQLNRVSPNGSLVVAFDRKNGQIRWKTGDDLASYSSPRPMIIGDRTVALFFARDSLHVIDPKDGRDLGSVYHRAAILESVNAMMPVVLGDQVFISDCYDLGSACYRIAISDDKATFTEIWKDPPGRRREQAIRSHLSTPILKDGFLYACSGRNAPDSDFRCVDFNTGDVQWTALERGRSTATLLGDVLLILKEAGTLHMAKAQPDRYEELAVWDLTEPSDDRPALNYPCWSAPVVVGNQILVRGDRTLVSLALPIPN